MKYSWSSVKKDNLESIPSCSIWECGHHTVEKHHILPEKHANFNGPTEWYNGIALCPNHHSTITDILRTELIDSDYEYYISMVKHSAYKHYVNKTISVALKLFNLSMITSFLKRDYSAALYMLLESLPTLRALNLTTLIEIIIENHSWLLNQKSGYLTIFFPKSKYKIVSNIKISNQSTLRKKYIKECIAFSCDYFEKKKTSNILELQTILKNDTLHTIDIEKDDNLLYFSNMTREYCFTNTIDIKPYIYLMNNYCIDPSRYTFNLLLNAFWKQYFYERKLDINLLVQATEIKNKSKSVNNWSKSELFYAYAFYYKRHKEYKKSIEMISMSNQLLKKSGINNIVIPNMWFEKKISFKEFIESISQYITKADLIDCLLYYSNKNE